MMMMLMIMMNVGDVDVNSDVDDDVRDIFHDTRCTKFLLLMSKSPTHARTHIVVCSNI
jgi:hypothetical protein